jgi:hypothetical protein
VATLNLLRLFYYTGEHELIQKAERTLRLFRDKMEDEPFSFGQMLCALDFYLETPKEVAIIGRSDQPDTQSLLHLVHESYLPNKILLVIDPAQATGDAFAHLPIGEMTQLGGKATAYVCHNFACSAPTTTPEALVELLK